MLASVLAGLSILIVGDSHLGSNGYLIDTLHDALLADGAQVHTIGVCGTNPGDWVQSVQGTCGGAERRGKAPLVKQNPAKTQPIGQLIDADKANLVIVIMGDTIGGYKQDAFPKTWVWQQVTSFTKVVAEHKTACVWVGPAWGSEGGKYGKTYAKAQQISSFLSNNVAPCSYVDSLKFSKPGEWGTIDGQHLTLTAYKYWGKDIEQAIVQIPALQQLKRP
ncbi:MAG TPA: SGNH/GDSL hydrolase family protein [Bordetella sp.]